MHSVGLIGYGLSAVAFLLLSVLLALAWQGRSQGIRLIVAAALTALWSAALAAFAWMDSAPVGTIFLGETLTSAAWLAVLGALLGGAGFPRLVARVALLAWVAATLLGIAAVAILPGLATEVVMACGLGLALLGLVLLEQLYRNSNTSGRWALRYLYLGVGGLFVYDLFLYSQGLLVGGVSPEIWQARGYVFALTVPFIAIAARRNPDWSFKVFVSRDIAFYGTSVLSVGAYLLLTSAGGYLVRMLGGVWGAVGQIVFFAAALALLGTLVGSTALRQRLRVFLAKHFYRNKYDYREEWLRFINTLSAGSADETLSVTSVRAVAQIIGSPRAELLLCTERPDHWRSEAIWPGGQRMAGGSGELLASPCLSNFLQGRQWVVDLTEYAADPSRYGDLALPEWITASGNWRLVVPVFLADGLFGMLLLANPPDGFELTYEDRDLLKTTGRHIATHLAQHQSEQRLAEGQQFAAFNKLSAFIMHDLKNATAQLELVVVNARKHKHNPEFIDDAIETVAGSVERIARLIAQLQQGGAGASSEVLDLAHAVTEVIFRTQVREPKPSFRQVPGPLPVQAQRERLGNVLEHLVRNAQESATASGQVDVSTSVSGGQVTLDICDNGAGMSADFIKNHLFRPFDSTKGSKGMGIGAYQAREYVQSIGGWIEVTSVVGQGTRVRVVLPQAGCK